jgi:hypothetical protein
MGLSAQAVRSYGASFCVHVLSALVAAAVATAFVVVCSVESHWARKYAWQCQYRAQQSWSGAKIRLGLPKSRPTVLNGIWRG